MVASCGVACCVARRAYSVLGASSLVALYACWLLMDGVTTKEQTPMKKVIEETEELCSLCGGRGQEQTFGGCTTAAFANCRQCHGRGFLVTKRVIRYEEVELRSPDHP